MLLGGFTERARLRLEGGEPELPAGGGIVRGKRADLDVRRHGDKLQDRIAGAELARIGAAASRVRVAALYF